ncbi:MAG: type transport system ATP-binding protein [Thermococcaceae archaeon]|jgi:ABC-2 type transport system ATP-binding protein|uniref:ABC transporter ATP-binding protein n=1 Tax=Thermococcus sp. PK TaxID=913025 RepID=UPI0005B25545|nr:ABC transporter ATP-binding protein [Thermococcus sp. PK]KUJ99338.1 MAG: Multidrug ABC transporter ATPase component [Thermococcales archaeon 44_46]MDK2783664.1 type transport system ATP-binding protein [Thermococcaceae archaeon]MDK2853669.1 type transport system ATP-binding protein [Thermococcaceae archaeon]MDK2983682.1 type transport system ATP-binding protein [Thermococcaceae archaeon]MDN5321008.1 type transport system ATP-binding protein [Thermococcaceae archaeon]
MRIISVSDLWKRFNSEWVLKGISFEVKREIFGFIGPNGAGKTTTIRIVLGILNANRGSVKIFGKKPSELSVEERRRIGYVQQRISFEPYISVFENIWLYGYLKGLSKDEAKERALKLINEFDLEPNKKAVELSIGQRRRLQIARELVCKPDLLFLDEPTIGLDVESKHKLLNILRELEIPIFFTTHNLWEAEKLCDRVAIIHQGQILTIASPKSLIRETQSENLEEAYLKVIKNETLNISKYKNNL